MPGNDDNGAVNLPDKVPLLWDGRPQDSAEERGEAPQIAKDPIRELEQKDRIIKQLKEQYAELERSVQSLDRDMDKAYANKLAAMGKALDQAVLRVHGAERTLEQVTNASNINTDNICNAIEALKLKNEEYTIRIRNWERHDKIAEDAICNLQDLWIAFGEILGLIREFEKDGSSDLAVNESTGRPSFLATAVVDPHRRDQSITVEALAALLSNTIPKCLEAVLHSRQRAIGSVAATNDSGGPTD